MRDRIAKLSTIVLSLILAVVLQGEICSGIKAQTKSQTDKTPTFKAWRISYSQGGGLKGFSKAYSIDSESNLKVKNNKDETIKEVEKSDLSIIKNLLQQLKLPTTKTKVVKGKQIYDGIYSTFTITLDGKDFRVEGSSFYDAKYLYLTKTQQDTLKQLKEKLSEIGFWKLSDNQ